MSERQQKSIRSDSEREKADRVYRAIEDPEIDDRKAMRILRTELGWKDWFFADFLRYVYWLAALAFDMFVILELARVYHASDPLGISLMIALLVALVVLEYLPYRRVWPEGPLTRRNYPRFP